MQILKRYQNLVKQTVFKLHFVLQNKVLEIA